MGEKRVDESIKISFVLAIYNVETYLGECIESIVSESGNYEVLLIDDGSTDGSGTICDEYERKFQQIRAFHKKNGGLSDARNYGLLRAKGKYVFFVDSDDFLPQGSTKKLLDIAAEKEADVIVWNTSVVDEKNRAIEYCNGKYRHPALKETREYLPNEFIETQLNKEKDFPRTVWLGMYKRQFLVSECLWFEKGILHEDELWTPQVYLKANSIFYINEELYCYRIRQNSIMNKMDKNYSRNLKSIIYIYNTLPILFDYNVKDGVFRRCLKEDISKRYLSAIAKYEAYRYPAIARDIRKEEIHKNASLGRDKIRAFVLRLNTKWYCILNNGLKKK